MVLIVVSSTFEARHLRKRGMPRWMVFCIVVLPFVLGAALWFGVRRPHL